MFRLALPGDIYYFFALPTLTFSLLVPRNTWCGKACFGAQVKWVQSTELDIVLGSFCNLSRPQRPPSKIPKGARPLRTRMPTCINVNKGWRKSLFEMKLTKGYLINNTSHKFARASDLKQLAFQRHNLSSIIQDVCKNSLSLSCK